MEQRQGVGLQGRSTGEKRRGRSLGTIGKKDAFGAGAWGRWKNSYQQGDLAREGSRVARYGGEGIGGLMGVTCRREKGLHF